MKILTGIQASGDLHIGNYFGAIRQMVKAQENMKKGDEVFMMIADMHAITSLRDGAALRKNVENCILDYLACGIDPEKITFYVQSDIPEVAELSWYLSSVTPLGMLNQAHSYKDKTAKGLHANAGLYTYPILMAADILIVNSDLVPVGKDQIQHVEMTRDIAIKFNNEYGEVFSLPEYKVEEELKLIPGIDGQKMSKSYGNTIPLFGEESQIKKTVMSIVTDSTGVDEPKDPDNCNVVAIYKLFASENELKQMEENYRKGGYGYGDAKKELFEKIKEKFGGMWEKRKELESEKGLCERVRKIGMEKMHKSARKVLDKCRRKVGVR